eukprot:m.845528 g.845528  ORF g.845528 m.845528 type:complete len:501 (+) comp23477_c1_seq35:601-2103(+)
MNWRKISWQASMVLKCSYVRMLNHQWSSIMRKLGTVVALRVCFLVIGKRTVTGLVEQGTVRQVPSWQYEGFNRFPAEFFGSNVTGLDNETQLLFDSRHQIAGWGWQVDMAVAEMDVVKTGVIPPGYNFSLEATLDANVQNLRASLHRNQSCTMQTQAMFVYRQGFFADFMYTQSRKFYNTNYVVRDSSSHKLCSKPADPAFGVWNWDNPSALNYYLDTVVAELCHERANGGAEVAYFDSADAMGDMSDSVKPGKAGIWHGLNCTQNRSLAEWHASYTASAKVLAAVGAALNTCGVWPVFSLGNAISRDVSAARHYVDTEQVFIDALAEKDVRWSRYYEFWGTGSWGVNAGYSIENALLEATQGIPINVHAYPTAVANAANNSIVRTDATYAVASFLIVQSEYSYFGMSSVSRAWPCRGAARQWSDCSWKWEAEYDQVYGQPLGNATKLRSVGHAGVWTRQFTNADVWVDEIHTMANITVHHPPAVFTYTQGATGVFTPSH